MSSANDRLQVRQTQLGLCTLGFSAAEAARAGVLHLGPVGGLFDGFTPWVWGIVFLKACGGLLVAATVKVRPGGVGSVVWVCGA